MYLNKKKLFIEMASIVLLCSWPSKILDKSDPPENSGLRGITTHSPSLVELGCVIYA